MRKVKVCDKNTVPGENISFPAEDYQLDITKVKEYLSNEIYFRYTNSKVKKEYFHIFD